MTASGRPAAPQSALDAAQDFWSNAKLTRDQKRALHAYERVAKIRTRPFADDYRRIVDDFGLVARRTGLSAAFAEVERRGGDASKQFLDDLAGARLHSLGADLRGVHIAAAVRGLDMFDYLLVTREVLKVVVWFKRAGQALLVKGEADAQRAS